MTNVIDFPKGRRPGAGPTTRQEAIDAALDIRLTHVDEVLDAAVDGLFVDLNIGGFDFYGQGDVYDRDIAFLLNSLRSLMLKRVGISHEFQDLAQDVMRIDDAGTVTIAANSAPMIATKKKVKR